MRLRTELLGLEINLQFWRFFCFGQTLEAEIVTCKDVQKRYLLLSKALTLLSNNRSFLKGLKVKHKMSFFS